MNIALLLGLDFFEGALAAFLYLGAPSALPYLGALEQEARIKIIIKVFGKKFKFYYNICEPRFDFNLIWL